MDLYVCPSSPKMYAALSHSTVLSGREEGPDNFSLIHLSFLNFYIKFFTMEEPLGGGGKCMGLREPLLKISTAHDVIA